jgi:hypothetical protein
MPPAPFQIFALRLQLNNLLELLLKRIATLLHANKMLAFKPPKYNELRGCINKHVFIEVYDDFLCWISSSFHFRLSYNCEWRHVVSR